jgi:hypothetical protein
MKLVVAVSSGWKSIVHSFPYLHMNSKRVHQGRKHFKRLLTSNFTTLQLCNSGRTNWAIITRHLAVRAAAIEGQSTQTPECQMKALFVVFMLA